MEQYKKNLTNKFKHQFCCTSCKDQIIGDLFHCGICKSYYLCEFCESSSDHSHPLLKIKDDKQYVDSLAYELKGKKKKEVKAVARK